MRLCNLGITCIVLFFLQSSFLPYFLTGHAFDLWLAAIALGAIIIDRKNAFFLALAGGLFQDIVAGNFFGIHLIPYLLITFIYVKFGKEKYNKHWYVSLLSVMIASAAVFAMEGIILYLSGNRISVSLTVGERLLSFILWNGIFSLLLHHVLWAMKWEGESHW